MCLILYNSFLFTLSASANLCDKYMDKKSCSGDKKCTWVIGVWVNSAWSGGWTCITKRRNMKPKIVKDESDDFGTPF